MPVGAFSFVHVIAPETVLVASLSFAIHLNRDGDGQIGSITLRTPHQGPHCQASLKVAHLD
ncbi:hypothetical protein Ahy_B10g106064 isoform B [Arachis hypogaea]|uniref:Uncharacterized protein n=1 Tax=Arachis hypogaea TaxID=3818 RepID=A0A444X9P9_ARAHY|nr:hypothetical protein Ahy_B10g106064 isoform B [Arachis hypogaea]